MTFLWPALEVHSPRIILILRGSFVKLLNGFFVLVLVSSFCSNSFAGKLKDLVIETDDAIYSEFYENAHLAVTEISGHELKKQTDELVVSAKVVAVNPANNMVTKWLCLVSFERRDEGYRPFDINCSGL